MALDPKSSPTPPGAVTTPRRDKGIRIFSYPKVIYLFPTLLVSLICWVGMFLIHDRTVDPTKQPAAARAQAGATATAAAPGAGETTMQKHDRFKEPQNLFAVLFLVTFGFNLLIMALDFPRFTIVGIILLILFAVFFVLWIGAYFEVDLMIWVRNVMATIYATANAEFYLLTALMMSAVFLIVYLTRWLDYWEVLPNEILHHHGPLSDLERYPTANLKFDKEIPDVLEHLFLGSGRLVLHFSTEHRSVVLDNVLFINAVENALKSLMSRMEVRLTTDQEVADI